MALKHSTEGPPNHSTSIIQHLQFSVPVGQGWFHALDARGRCSRTPRSCHATGGGRHVWNLQACGLCCSQSCCMRGAQLQFRQKCMQASCTATRRSCACLHTQPGAPSKRAELPKHLVANTVRCSPSSCSCTSQAVHSVLLNTGPVLLAACSSDPAAPLPWQRERVRT